MTTLSKHTIAATLALALTNVLATSEAMACTTEIKRGQITVFGKLDDKRDLLPQEAAVKVGDLISVLAPRGVNVHVVAHDDLPSSALVSITPDRYKLLSKQGGGTVPPEIHTQSLPKKYEWLHFGAASTGAIYLKLASDNERGLVRVEIGERPAVNRGANLNWNEDRQSEAIHLTQFDTLTLDLPGEPGSGWLVGMRQGKATLKSVSQVNADIGSTQPRVLLRIEASPGTPEDELTVTRSGTEGYRFTVRPKAIPKC